MPRHHIVPQMILRRFANAQGQIVLQPREGDGVPFPLAIRKACSEVGFYEIPTSDILEDFQDEHDSELVEKTLSDIEGTANEIIEGILGGRFPLNAAGKFKMSLFMGLQMSRGWSFREGMNQVAQNYLELAAEARFPDLLPGEFPQIKASKTFAIQHGLKTAIDVLMSHLYFRTWRVLRFETPCLLTSDNPFGYWAPPGLAEYGPFGVGNAPLVFFPLDRTTVLAMSSSAGREGIVKSGNTRAGQVNFAVACEAEKWVMHHPDDSPLNEIELPPRGRFVREFVSERVTDDGEIRHLYRVVKR